MIIKQYHDVIAGDKTETRRIADRYTVGKVYAVVPKMYKPTIWYRWAGKIPYIWHEEYAEVSPVPTESERHMWTPLRVKVVAKRKEPLLAIDEQGAIAEGIQWDSSLIAAFYCGLLPGRWFETAVDGYRALWESINTKKGTRWEDNPLVNVITFEVVK